MLPQAAFSTFPDHHHYAHLQLSESDVIGHSIP